MPEHALSTLVSIPALLGILLIVPPAPARAQEPAAPVRKSLGNEGDCGETRLLFQDRSDLTREERLALMEKALLRSLSRFDACQTGAAPQAGGGGAGGNGAAGGTGGNGAAQGGNVASVAASDMQGTEQQEGMKAPADKEKAEKADNSQDPAAAGAKDGKTTLAQTRGGGKTPEDIPSANNDSLLEAQIRRAAESEADPEKAKKLWNEYRRYKGLPAK